MFCSLEIIERDSDIGGCSKRTSIDAMGYCNGRPIQFSENGK